MLLIKLRIFFDTARKSTLFFMSSTIFINPNSRYPEPGSFSGWQALFTKFQNASYTASGPLSFIPTWIPPVDDQPHQPLYLTSTGARESFDLGVELRKRYRLTPGGANFTVW